MKPAAPAVGCVRGQVDSAKCLLMRGADLNDPCDSTRMPLHIAVPTASIAAVSLLLRHVAEAQAFIGRARPLGAPSRIDGPARLRSASFGEA